VLLTFDQTGAKSLAGASSATTEWVALRIEALPIGDNFTMDAVKAAEFVRCDDVLALHYNTFPPIKIDTAAATARFNAAGKRLHLPGVGQECEM
jgi:L-ascorbate metabolism protein UlaG (beta-lactamase superfamily)